jgi:hypothetical protein
MTAGSGAGTQDGLARDELLDACRGWWYRCAADTGSGSAPSVSTRCHGVIVQSVRR